MSLWSKDPPDAIPGNTLGGCQSIALLFFLHPWPEAAAPSEQALADSSWEVMLFKGGVMPFMIAAALWLGACVLGLYDCV